MSKIYIYTYFFILAIFKHYFNYLLNILDKIKNVCYTALLQLKHTVTQIASDFVLYTGRWQIR